MNIRVRHPGQPPRDVDLGPCPEVRGSLGGFIQAAPIGSMTPLIVGTVHSSMSDGHPPKAQAFSIHPENRTPTQNERYFLRTAPRASGRFKPYELVPRCGATMPRAGVRCYKVAGHSTRGGGDGHRSKAAMDADRARERAARAAA